MLDTHKYTELFQGCLADWWRAKKCVYEQTQIFITVDEHTHKLCLPYFLDSCVGLSAHIITIPSGEQHKTLSTLEHVWDTLLQYGASRKSVLFNLGGGVLCDLGGFAASTFKRGLQFVHVPTTLLAMVDASVGGKTGINYKAYKNMIGVINEANAVLVDSHFLMTLPQEHLVSGYAEMLKHALLAGREAWESIKQIDPTQLAKGDLGGLIESSLHIKHDYVSRDPYERGIRKALNFGHTIGHAIESYALTLNRPMLHGSAVAYGMLAELYLSQKYFGFSKKLVEEYATVVGKIFKTIPFNLSYEELQVYMKQDKKNDSQTILFTLFSALGCIEIDVVCEEEDIRLAIDYANGILELA